MNDACGIRLTVLKLLAVLRFEGPIFFVLIVTNIFKRAPSADFVHQIRRLGRASGRKPFHVLFRLFIPNRIQMLTSRHAMRETCDTGHGQFADEKRLWSLFGDHV